MAHIFIIDDDEQQLRMTSMMLERGGHQVTTNSDPVEGLEAVKQELPDLAIIDMMMPRMSGLDVCTEIRADERTADMMLIMLTAAIPDEEHEILRVADVYLNKPIMSHGLLSQVNKLLHDKTRTGTEQLNDATVIAVFGLTGGAGRTSLSVNLALSLAERTNHVSLIDFTQTGGQAAMQLRLSPRTSWANLLDTSVTNWSLIRSQFAEYGSTGMSILPAPRRPLPMTGISADSVTHLLETMQPHFRYIVIDLPAMWATAVETVVRTADIVLHVVNPTVISVQTMQRAERSFRTSDLNLKQRFFVLNRVTNAPLLDKQAVSRGLRTDIAFEIPFDSRQHAALMRGKPLVRDRSQTPLGTAVREIADKVWQTTSD